MLNPQRILVIGTSGSGKSTLARRIADRLGLRFVATDELYWRPGWVPVPGDAVIEEVLAVAAGDRWVLDRNFDSQRQRLWPLADLVVWLDLPRTTVLRAVAIRNVAWFIGRRVVWAGNRMTLRSAASGIRHAHTTYVTKRERYPTWLAELGVDHVRLRSRKEIEHWVETFPTSRGHAERTAR